MNIMEGQIEKQSVMKIENCWCSYRDKQMFKVLKQAISSADHSLTADIMRKINPNEAVLLKDPIFQTKIRFRFSGEEFPPNIVFKVFIQTNGIGVKYLCGKKIIKPASQAAADSCTFMGNRKFLDQMLKDLCDDEQLGVDDEADVSNMKDYMKYLALLDENTAESGGKANTWRTLTSDVVPRNHIISDVLVYLHHGTKTQQFLDYFQQANKTNLVPLTQTQQVEYIKLLHNRKHSEPKRGSKQARQRAARMRMIYQQRDKNELDEVASPINYRRNNNNDNDNNNCDDDGNDNDNDNDNDNIEDNGDVEQKYVPISPLLQNEDINFDDDLWDEEGQLLFEWTKNLSLTNLAESR